MQSIVCFLFFFLTVLIIHSLAVNTLFTFILIDLTLAYVVILALAVKIEFTCNAAVLLSSNTSLRQIILKLHSHTTASHVHHSWLSLQVIPKSVWVGTTSTILTLSLVTQIGTSHFSSSV